ncbi:P-loop containing nucleoside triphosphate hydrolase protein [Entophlyctis helioformis]|nr:P-loop containing nucleoside triphosphate hydrolase protein [Entophlyctis helioformis]
MRRSAAPSKRKLAAEMAAGAAGAASAGPASEQRRPPQPAPPQHLQARQPAAAAAAARHPTTTKAPTAFGRQSSSINTPAAQSAASDACGGSDPGEQYSVVFRKQTSKVHKTWDGDGFLIVQDGMLKLKDADGTVIASGRKNSPLEEGATFRVGQKEVEITARVSLAQTKAKPAAAVPAPAAPALVAMPAFKSHRIATIRSAPPPKNEPRHDPSAPGALVMPRPPPSSVPPGTQVVDVVVDPIISKRLRPHQREGITFLYSCLADREHSGAILADEMGLGKTIQTIGLIWTLLKQSPIVGTQPLRRALVKEFRKWLGDHRLRVYAVEGAKTGIADFVVGRVYSVLVVGYERMRSFAAELGDAKFDIIVCDEGHRLKNSAIQASQILNGLGATKRIILSGTPIQNDLSEFYAMVDFVNPGLLGKRAAFKRQYEDPILRGRAPDCDAQESTLSNERMQELVNLTKSFVLRRTADINAQYLPDKTEVVLFCRMTPTQTGLYQSLIESPDVTASLSGTPAVAGSAGSGTTVLALMTRLRKCVNSPALIDDTSEMPEDTPARSNSSTKSLGMAPLRSVLPPLDSGKMKVLENLLSAMRAAEPDAKVVLVSNWTATLDLFEQVARKGSYSFVRLDGQTPSAKRQTIVDKFNGDSTFLFLLSSKAGGVGLNLVGASRLVLFDIDWNPAVDLQAMARIWRDGQRRNVTIYRLLTTGTIEERIYQRQITKMALSDTVIDNAQNSANSFTSDELRDIFSLDTDTACLTHDTLGCACGGGSGGSSSPATHLPGDDEEDEEEDLGLGDDRTDKEGDGWTHYSAPFAGESVCGDADGGVLGPALSASGQSVSFVFARQSAG